MLFRSRIGDTSFTTSLWPKDGAYYLPLKDAVRKAENIRLGATITIECSLQSPSKRSTKGR